MRLRALPGISLFLWATQALALCTWIEQSEKRLPVFRKEGGDPIKAMIQEYGPEVIIDYGFDFANGSRIVQTVDSPTTLGYVTVVHPDPKVIQEIRTRIRQAENSGLVVH